MNTSIWRETIRPFFFPILIVAQAALLVTGSIALFAQVSAHELRSLLLLFVIGAMYRGYCLWTIRHACKDLQKIANAEPLQWHW